VNFHVRRNHLLIERWNVAANFKRGRVPPPTSESGVSLVPAGAHLVEFCTWSTGAHTCRSTLHPCTLSPPAVKIELLRDSDCATARVIAHHCRVPEVMSINRPTLRVCLIVVLPFPNQPSQPSNFCINSLENDLLRRRRQGCS
jgi:hypothetical protein